MSARPAIASRSGRAARSAVSALSGITAAAITAKCSALTSCASGTRTPVAAGAAVPAVPSLLSDERKHDSLVGHSRQLKDQITSIRSVHSRFAVATRLSIATRVSVAASVCAGCAGTCRAGAAIRSTSGLRFLGWEGRDDNLIVVRDCHAASDLEFETNRSDVNDRARRKFEILNEPCFPSSRDLADVDRPLDDIVSPPRIHTQQVHE